MNILKTACRILIIYSSCFLFFIEYAAAAEPTPTPVAVGISDSDFLVKDVGTFAYSGRNYRIWASVRNDTAKSPRQWQFLYEPLLQPVRKQGGVEAVISGQTVTFELALSSSEARTRAKESLDKTFPSESKDIVLTNIRSLPIKSITLKTKDIKDIDPNAVLIDSTIPVGGLPEKVSFRIRASSTTKASDIAAQLPNFIFEYDISLSTRVAFRAAAKVEGTQVLLNEFRASLDGVPKTAEGNNFVHRSDFRKFIESHQDQLLSNVTIENGIIAVPDEFIKSVVDNFMKRWDTLVSKNLNKLDDTSKQSTFHIQDLTPDKITEAINKTFTYDQSEKQFKVNVEGNTEGSVSIGKISAGSKMGGKYSKEEVEKILRQNDIDAEWKGEKWIVKDLSVRQVNDTAISSLSSTMSVYTQVLPPETKVESGQIPFGTTTSDGVESIGGRLSYLENTVQIFNTLPIGTILPYYGKFEALENTGWVVCNSQNASKHPNIVPNLENRFLQGVGDDKLGASGGAKVIALDGAHTPSGSVSVWKTGARDGNGFMGQGNHNQLPAGSFTGNAIANHNHGGENRPPFYTVNFIIRIK